MPGPIQTAVLSCNDLVPCFSATVTRGDREGPSFDGHCFPTKNPKHSGLSILSSLLYELLLFEKRKCLPVDTTS